MTGKGSEGQDIPGQQVIPGAAQGVGKVRDEGAACAVLQRLLVTRPPLLGPPLPPYQQVLHSMAVSQCVNKSRTQKEGEQVMRKKVMRS